MTNLCDFCVEIADRHPDLSCIVRHSTRYGRTVFGDYAHMCEDHYIVYGVTQPKGKT